MEKIMKRIVYPMLIAMMLLSFALAEESNTPVLYQLDDDTNLVRDWADMLGLKKPLKTLWTREDPMELLASDHAPDIFCPSYFSEMKEAGFLGAFEPTDLMRQEMDAMPQIVKQMFQDYLLTEDGKLLAYPDNVDILSMGFWVPDAWADSPFRDMTPPSSVKELLDFLELYLETPHDGFCFIYDVRGQWNTQRALYTLMRCWAVQCNHTGKPLIYNDPLFISLAERTIDLTTRLWKIEKGVKKQKGRQLFMDQCFGHTGNNKDTVTYANLIPWRITSDQPPLVMVWTQLYAVRNGSAFVDIAPELFERIIVHRDDLYHGKPWTMVYEKINPSRVNVEEMNSLFLKEDGEKYSWQHYTQEYVDSVYDIHKYAIPTLASDNTEGQGTWTTRKYSYESFMSVMKKFLNGKMTAAEFAAKWDQMTGTAE